MANDEDAATKLFRKLQKEHPNASEDELLNLVLEAAKADEEATRALVEFYHRRGGRQDN